MFNGIHFEYTHMYIVHTCTCIHIFTYIICNAYDVSAYWNAQIYYVGFSRYAHTDLILHASFGCLLAFQHITPFSVREDTCVGRNGYLLTRLGIKSANRS